MTALYRGFALEELEREYSPSSRVPDIQPFLDRYAALSAEVRDALTATGQSRLDLAYGEKATQTLDLFLPSEAPLTTQDASAAANAAAPALHVFIHGGYWQLLDKADSSFGALSFCRAGVAYCAVNYTLAPDASLDDIVGEVRAAIAWLYQHASQLGFSRDRIYLSGSSAGAHLAAMALCTTWSDYDVPMDIIKGVCAVSGVYDLEPIRHTYINEPLHLTEETARDNSPLFLTPAHPCPVVVAYGDNETDEFKRQSKDYALALEKHQLPVKQREIPHRNHFDVILDLADSTSALWSLSYAMIR